MTDPAPVAAPDHHIRITRFFDAPRSSVFAAWTEPEQVAGWFCPDGFRVPVESVVIELRPGGRYELTMLHGSGREHHLRYRILELVEPELLVLESPAHPGAAIVTRIELADEDDRTRMTLSDGPHPAEGGPAAEGGWGQAFDKLQRLLT